ncbi:MAG: hypothetical protein VX641_01370 [Planctomycetota bacterium]|nr:hypothetical protein [Planctomycetota bacterium]
MLHLITAFMASAMLTCTSTGTLQEAGAPAVPAAYQKLISKDTRFVFYMKNPSRVLHEAKSLDLGTVPEPTLSAGMRLPFTTEQPIQADQFFIAWSDALPKLFDMPELHVATTIPADMVGKLEPKPGYSIEYEGRIAIFTLKKGGTWKMPEHAGCSLIDSLPEADVAAAFEGTEIGSTLSEYLNEYLQMAPMMFGARMEESIRGAEKYGESGISKAIKSATQDFQNHVEQVLSTIRSTRIVSAGMDIGENAVTVDVDIRLTEDMTTTSSFDEHLIDQLPPALPLYLALSGPAARWITQIEFDVLEGFLINKEEQIARFEALKTQWNTMTGLIDRGMTVGMSLNTKYQWSNVQTTDGAAFLSACNEVMKDLGKLDVGISTKPNGSDSWKMDIDGMRIGKLMETSPQQQQVIADRFGGTYGTSAVRSGNLVMAKQYPFDAPKFPVFDQDQTLSNRLKGAQVENLIVGVAADLGLMARHAAVKNMERQGNTDKARMIKATLPREPIAMHADLTLMSPREVGLSIDFPTKPYLEYFRRLEAMQADRDAAPQTPPNTPGATRP